MFHIARIFALFSTKLQNVSILLALTDIIHLFLTPALERMPLTILIIFYMTLITYVPFNLQRSLWFEVVVKLAKFGNCNLFLIILSTFWLIAKVQ
jgi:hypothetical protein